MTGCEASPGAASDEAASESGSTPPRDRAFPRSSQRGIFVHRLTALSAVGFDIVEGTSISSSMLPNGLESRGCPAPPTVVPLLNGFPVEEASNIDSIGGDSPTGQSPNGEIVDVSGLRDRLDDVALGGRDPEHHGVEHRAVNGNGAHWERHYEYEVHPINHIVPPDLPGSDEGFSTGEPCDAPLYPSLSGFIIPMSRSRTEASQPNAARPQPPSNTLT